AASIDTVRSPSIKPDHLNQSAFSKKKIWELPLAPEGRLFFVATNVVVTLSGDWFAAFAVNVRTAVLVPEARPFQFLTEMNIRCSGLSLATEPLVCDSDTQLALLVILKENGWGPPMPTSTNRLPKTSKLSMVTVGGGQLYP